MTRILTRKIVHIILLLIGLCLMLGGIMSGKHGATVIGLIVAAVNAQLWMQWNKKRKQH